MESLPSFSSGRVHADRDVDRDRGSAGRHPCDEFDLQRGKLGVGTGLRVLMPAVDMTRFEVGYGEDGWRFYLATFSKMQAQRWRLR